ncbi:MAG: HemD protein, partial [Desulfobulbus sp.]|nr:HemD protein [Desulfobulbus sp.]
NFLAMIEAEDTTALHRMLDQVDIAAIGPVTAETVQKYGLDVTVQPQRYTISDMVQAIIAHYRNKTGHGA